MSNSDSEDFESADEGEAVTEQKSKKASSSKTKSSDVTNIPKQEDVIEKKEEPVKQEEQQQSRWSPWGGAFSIISNASKSVASITTSVSQSITSAIESSINIPEPEEMAKLHSEERKMSKQSDGSEKAAVDEKSGTDDRSFKLDSIVSGVSQMSSKLVSGGLDTLEGIGKKTITILQETNPDIKNKIRGINNQPVLSDILKEAKERSDENSANSKESETNAFKQVSFDILFEDYKGTVFIEALGILSNQSKMKVDMVMKPLDGKALQEIEETLSEVKELCELPDIETDDDIALDQLEEKLKSAVEDLNVQLNFKELISCVLKTKEWLDNLEKDATGQSIYTKSIESLANICALSLGTMHKLAELLLSLDHRSTADEADSLIQLTTTYCHLLNHVASLFSTKITALESNDENKKFVTNIFLESSNSITHIKSAFGLYIPILQIGAI